MRQSNSDHRFSKASASLLLSFTFHLGILFILSLLKEDKIPERPEVTIITTQTEAPKEADVFPDPIICEVPTPKVFDVKDIVTPQESTPSPEIEKPIVITDIDLNTKPDEIFALPSVDSATSTPVIAIFSPASAPLKGSIPGLRDASTDVKIKLTDTDRPSIQAVEAALKWLALHQESDGSWDATKYEGSDNGERSAETAIALLAFLGYGQSEVSGQYKENVRKGIRYLNTVVDKRCKDKKELLFGRTYGSALVLMALSESTMFSANPLTKRNANAMAEYLLQAHGGTDAGWHYKGPGDDFSVSGWVALALKSAYMAKLPSLKDKLYDNTVSNYKNWVHSNMANPLTGMARYNQKAKQENRNMSLVAMVVKSFMNYDNKDPFMKKASEHGADWTKQLLGDKPKDSYGIYYGSLAAFMSNGPFWKIWNDSMKVCLVKAQCQGDPKELGGSWNPTPSHTGKMGGRVMDTALFTLSLEACYRFDRTSDS